MNKLLISVLVLSACLTACSKSTNVDNSNPREVKTEYVVELYSAGTVVRTWHNVTYYVCGGPNLGDGAIRITLKDGTQVIVNGDFVMSPEK